MAFQTILENDSTWVSKLNSNFVSLATSEYLATSSTELLYSSVVPAEAVSGDTLLTLEADRVIGYSTTKYSDLIKTTKNFSFTSDLDINNMVLGEIQRQSTYTFIHQVTVDSGSFLTLPMPTGLVCTLKVTATSNDNIAGIVNIIPSGDFKHVTNILGTSNITTDIVSTPPGVDEIALCCVNGDLEVHNGFASTISFSIEVHGFIMNFSDLFPKEYFQLQNVHDAFNDSSIVATYQLNGNANDSGGTYNGTPTDITYSTGKFGQAAVFNGTTSRIALGDTALDGLRTGDGTISAWINVSNLSDSRTIVGSSHDVLGQIFSLRVDTTGHVSSFPFTVTAPKPVSLTALNTGEWYFITWVHRGDNFEIWINGVFECAVTHATTNEVGDYQIGTVEDINNQGSYQQYFAGSIDQLRFFNKALTQSEISQLMAENSHEYEMPDYLSTKHDVFGDSSCLVTYLFDDTITDLGGNYDATVAAGTATYTNGRFNKGFHGALTNVLSLNAVPFDRTVVNFSISTWIYIEDKTSRSTIFMNYLNDTTYLEVNLNKLSFVVRNADTTYSSVQPTADIDENRWIHVAGTVAENGFLKLYVDGQFINQVAVSGTRYNAGFSNRYIGANAANLTSKLDGAVDQFRLFNRELTASEVATLASGTEDVPTQVVVGDASIDFSDINAIDLVTNADPFDNGECICTYRLDGDYTDLGGTYNTTGSGTFFPEGKFGQGLLLDGDSQVINIPAALNTALSGLFTMSFWLHFDGAYTQEQMMYLGGDQLWASSDQRVYAKFDEVNGLVVIAGEGSSNSIIYNSGVFPELGWNHIVLQLNPIAHMVGIYMNNVFLARPYSTFYSTIGSYEWIGRSLDADATTGRFFRGSLTQIRFFNYLLNDDEIATLYTEKGALGYRDTTHVHDIFGDGSAEATFMFDEDGSDLGGTYTASGAVIRGGGRFGSCYATNSLDTYINVPSLGTWFAGRTAFTFSMWAKPNIRTIGTGPTFMVSNTSHTAPHYRFYIYVTTTFIQGIVESGTGTGCYLAGTFAPDKFYHVTFSFSGPNMSMYVDGVLADTQNQGVTTVGATTSNACFGRIPALNSASNSSQVAVDQVRVFNRAITAQEAETLANPEYGPQVFKTENTHDIFEEGSSVATYTFDGDANDLGGTYNGTPTDITYAVSPLGKTAVFNGTTSYVDISNTPAIKTASFWVKLNPATGTSRDCLINNNAVGTKFQIIRWDTGLATTSFYFNTKNVAVPTATQDFLDWTHIIFSVDGTVYLNGVLYSGPDNTEDNVATLQFIGRLNTDVNYYTDGAIDQFRLFNRELVQEEVDVLFAEGRQTLTARVPYDLTTTHDVFNDATEEATWFFENDVVEESGVYTVTPTDITYVAGVHGQAASFNGTTSYGAVSPTMNMSGTYSYVAHVKPAAYPGCLIGTTAASVYYALYLTDTTLVVRDDANHFQTFSHSIPTGTWAHFVVVNINGVVHAYHDGVRMTPATTSGIVGAVAINQIGKQTGGGYFSGQMEELRVFDRAIHYEEARQLYLNTRENFLVPRWVSTEDSHDIFGDASALATYALNNSANDLNGVLNGTHIGAAQYTQGKFGSAAIKYTGSVVDTITLPTSIASDIRTAAEFSVSFWAKADQFGTQMRCFSLFDNLYFLIRYDTDGKIMPVILDSSSTNITLYSTTVPKLGSWYNIILTGSAATGVKLYINGVEEASNAWNGTFFTYTTAAYQWNTIGTHYNSTGNNVEPLYGAIDQVRIFDTVLTQKQIDLLQIEGGVA